MSVYFVLWNMFLKYFQTLRFPLYDIIDFLKLLDLKKKTLAAWSFGRMSGVGRFIIFRIDQNGLLSRRIKRWHVLSHRARSLWPSSGSWRGRFTPRNSTYTTQRHLSRHYHYSSKRSGSSFYRYKVLCFSNCSILDNNRHNYMYVTRKVWIKIKPFPTW